MEHGQFWAGQVQQLQLEYAKRNQNIKPRTIRFEGLSQAYSILQREERNEDISEFIALVAACLLSKDPVVLGQNEDRLDFRFRDLLERAITPACKD